MELKGNNMANFKDLARITFMDYKQSTNGSVMRMSVAIKRKHKNQSGEYETDFIPCVAFSKTADVINKLFVKGDRILIEGTLQVNNYEKDGEKKTSFNVVIDSVGLIEFKNSGTEKQTADIESPFDI